MKKQIGLMPETFNDLLEWFSENREEAGEKYEQIRNGLIRFFYFKGCADAENLADETINRVASKLSVLDLSQNTKPANIFYGFASKIFLECINDSKNREIEFDSNLGASLKTEDNLTESENKNYGCLEKCLAKLPIEESNLVVEYYSSEKSKKTECRRELAEKMKIKPETLSVKIYRLRKTLRKCIEKCVAEK